MVLTKKDRENGVYNAEGKVEIVLRDFYSTWNLYHWNIRGNCKPKTYERERVREGNLLRQDVGASLSDRLKVS